MNKDSGWTSRQYALFRALLGVYLCVHFVALLPWTTEIFSSEGVLPDAQASPAFAFPNLLWLSDTPAMLHGLVLSAALSAVLFGAGRLDRVAAVWMWLVLMALQARNPLIANPGMPFVGWMLVAHLFVPRMRVHEFGVDGIPDGTSPSWRMPIGVCVASWVVLALSYSYSGYTKLFSSAWLAGDAVALVLENPLARDWWLRELLVALPSSLLVGLTWFILWVELLYAPLFLLRRLRVWLWGSMLFVQFGFLLLLKFPDLTAPMLLMHFMACEPRWFDDRKARPVTLYFDGHCGLCHRVVRFALAEDRRALVRFAPLQGAAARAAALEETQRDGDTFVVVLGNGTRLVRSDALVALLRTLGGVWRVAGVLIGVFPRALRDSAYSFVGRRRSRLFAAPSTLCPLVPAALRDRFVAAE